MKKTILQFAIILAVLTSVSHAATVTVTNADDGVSNIGGPGTFYWAITNCNAGDTIAFNISGTGPFYLKEPPNGFPLIYRKGNLIIDGYTQPGASANSNPISGSNNAVIKIVIDGRNGNTRNMNYPKYGTTVTSDPPINNSFMSTEQGGYSDAERALLGVYRSTNVNIRGLAFLGKEPPVGPPGSVTKGICFAHDFDGDTTVMNQADYINGTGGGLSGSDRNGHINGCWFGINPTNQTVAGLTGYYMAVCGFRHRDVSGGSRAELPNVGMIIGVAPGSANPRAEFNIFAGCMQAFDMENVRTRVSGNFFHVFPDGVTPINIDFFASRGLMGPVPINMGRYNDTQPIVIGTDGDGVNDADEGNLFGPMGPIVDVAGTAAIPLMLNYSTGDKPWIIAGNTYGIANNGTVWPENSICIGVFTINDATKVRFGSDFNGVSDALEANRVYNNHVFNDPLMFGAAPWDWTANYGQTVPKDMIAMGCARASNYGTNVYQGANPNAFVSIRGNVLVNNFPSLNPGDTNVGVITDSLTGQFYPNIWSNYVLYASQTIPALSPSSSFTLAGTCGYPTNGYTNLIVDLYVPDPEGQTNGAQFGQVEFGGLGGWGYVQGRRYLGSFMDNGPLDSNPAVGAFSFNISGLGLTNGTKVTVAVTYTKDARPNITDFTRSGNSVTLTWTGGNGAGTSGFGIQRASSVSGPWTTVGFSWTNATVLTDTASTSFYRVLGPGAGMTTLFAPPVTLLPPGN